MDNRAGDTGYMNIECRFRLVAGGVPVMGKGPRDLLREVERSGSLREAAKHMGMAYSKAWTLIKRAEQVLGISFLDRKTGGSSGGGSRLTAEGLRFLETFESLEKDLSATAARLFADYFGQYELKPEHEI